MTNDPTYGLRKRKRKEGFAWYWIAPAKDVQNGYAPKSITLDADATLDEQLARCCAQHADLLAWREKRGDVATRYTFAWLINRYKTDEHSPYHLVKGKTRESYDGMCKIIDAAIGHKRIDPRLERGVYHPRILGQDVRKWHSDCGAPDKNGKPRPSRARHMIAVLRILSSYAVEIGVPGARDFRSLLATIRFPVTRPRESAPAREQVLAIVKTALDMGYRSIAATTLAQFLFTERRISILGEWEGPQWRPGWVWQNISPDWVITYHQTKVGRVERSYDLTETPALLEILQATPEEKRVGPIIVCETTNLPWRYRHYGATFRKVARAAGVPDGIWSMDMRAGGATEASAIAGIGMVDIQAAGGWTNPKTASRYMRGGVKLAQNVVRIREAKGE